MFDVGDALLTDPSARAFGELSQAARFQRAWPSLYEAREDGRIDRAALRRLFAQALPEHLVGTRWLLGLDTSLILRPDAVTSVNRTLVYRPNLPAVARAVEPGWSCSTLVVLPDPVRSWTDVLDNRRVPSTETAATIGVQHVRASLPLLAARGGRPIGVQVRHSSSAPWVLASADLPTDQLMRARRDRVL